MIRVGFLVDSPNYIGGMNYLFNLVYAVKKADKNNEIHFVLFFGKNLDEKVYNRFEPYCEIVKTSFCDKKSLNWITYKVLFKIFGFTFYMKNFLKDYNLDILSHSSFYGKNLPFKTIEWLPDFQFIHLPYMFTRFENFRRNKLYKDTIKSADALVVSSNDGANDFYNFSEKYHEKLHVLQFVSQINSHIYNMDNNEEILTKYGITNRFFYLPNQLWKHKNHLVVVEALRILKEEDFDIQVVCTGSLEDFRNPDYTNLVFEKVKEYNLKSNILFLGLIPYKDVQYLMRNCLSVINPSLFEGWSSTVEECKSMGKNMILSTIKVHLEQSPLESLYFDPEDPEELANCMKIESKKYNSEPNYGLESEARELLSSRTEAFGKKYIDIMKNVIPK